MFKDFNTWSVFMVVLFTLILCAIFIGITLLMYHFWSGKGVIYFWGSIITLLGIGILYTAYTMTWIMGRPTKKAREIKDKIKACREIQSGTNDWGEWSYEANMILLLKDRLEIELNK